MSYCNRNLRRALMWISLRVFTASFEARLARPLRSSDLQAVASEMFARDAVINMIFKLFLCNV